ncbi:MAG: caspase family protein [Archangiaceae bacterium]|nr:caspase family protein [Archangiaceae bacterium]
MLLARLALLALVAAGAAASAAPRRVAVVVGNDLGAPRDPQLRYARKDATRIAQVLRELGGVRGEDLQLLLDADADTVRLALERAGDARDGLEPTVLLFYYSGHADETALHLGPTRLEWADVRAFVDRDSAPLRLAIIDACRAGALTTPKGFTLAAPLTPPETGARGSAVMVAADSDAAQEDAALGGGVFTHFLIAALRGAADADRDRRVTLAEAHAYATAHTREATAARAAAIQRPAYHFDVSGQDDVVLTDLRDASASVTVHEQLQGHLVISDRESGLIVVETEKLRGEPLVLGLPSGRYRAHLRLQTALWVGELELPWGGSQLIGEGDLVPRSYQEVAQLWRQTIAAAPHRDALLFGVGFGAGVRVPMFWRLFGEASVEGIGYVANVQGAGLSLRPTGAFTLAVGAHF